jgi:hypothetical protein
MSLRSKESPTREEHRAIPLLKRKPSRALLNHRWVRTSHIKTEKIDAEQKSTLMTLAVGH